MGAFGLNGQVKVNPLTDFPSRFDVGSRLRLGETWTEVQSVRWKDGRPTLKLEGVNTINEAQALQWEYLLVPASSLPQMSQDEFLLDDLLGLPVVTVQGLNLGIVDDVMSLPAQDILVVNEIMIPLVKEFVKDIDLDAGLITVELIPGMLED